MPSLTWPHFIRGGGSLDWRGLWNLPLRVALIKWMLAVYPNICLAIQPQCIQGSQAGISYYHTRAIAMTYQTRVEEIEIGKNPKSVNKMLTIFLTHFFTHSFSYQAFPGIYYVSYIVLISRPCPCQFNAGVYKPSSPAPNPKTSQ